jgi:hypothetical protein
MTFIFIYCLDMSFNPNYHRSIISSPDSQTSACVSPTNHHRNYNQVKLVFYFIFIPRWFFPFYASHTFVDLLFFSLDKIRVKKKKKNSCESGG